MLEASQSWLPRVKENMSAQDMDDVLQLLLMDFGDETLHTAFTSSSLACTEPPLSADTPATQTSVETHLPITGGVGTRVCSVDSKITKPKSRSRRYRKRPKQEIEQLKAQVAVLEAKLKKLEKEGESSRDEAVRIATTYSLPPFNLMEAKLKDGTMPEVPTTSKLWERIALYEKKRERAAKDENAFLRSRTEEQKKVLVHLQDSMHEASRVERQSESTCAQEASSAATVEMLEASDGFESSSSSSDSSTRVPSKSLIRTLDQLHDQVDDVLSSCGILHQDVEMHRGPLWGDSLPLLVSSDYLEQIECRVFPFHFNVVDQIAWKCLGSAPMYHPNGVYEPQEYTPEYIRATFTDHLSLSRAKASGTTTMKRFIEADRVVIVSSVFCEVQGTYSACFSGDSMMVVRPPIDPSALPTSSVDEKVSVLQSYMTLKPSTDFSNQSGDIPQHCFPFLKKAMKDIMQNMLACMQLIENSLLRDAHLLST